MFELVNGLSKCSTNYGVMHVSGEDNRELRAKNQVYKMTIAHNNFL